MTKKKAQQSRDGLSWNHRMLELDVPSDITLIHAVQYGSCWPRGATEHFKRSGDMRYVKNVKYTLDFEEFIPKKKDIK